MLANEGFILLTVTVAGLHLKKVKPNAVWVLSLTSKDNIPHRHGQ